MKLGAGDWGILMDRWSSQDFKDKSAKNKANRSKYPTIHILGSTPAYQQKKKLVYHFMQSLMEITSGAIYWIRSNK